MKKSKFELLILVFLGMNPPLTWAQTDHTTYIKWNADSTSMQIPAGAKCGEGSGVLPCSAAHQCASIDTTTKAEGAASMKFTNAVGGSEGGGGCNIGGVNLPYNTWFFPTSPPWICYRFKMKFDPAFNWYVYDQSFKAGRIVSGDSGPGFTFHWKPDHFYAESAAHNTAMSAPFDSTIGGPNNMTVWHDYTVGFRFQTANGAPDGKFVFWVDGVEKTRADDAIWCDDPNCASPRQAWGSFLMTPYPQSPEGTIWFDDYEMTTGPSACQPRTATPSTKLSTPAVPKLLR